MDGGFALAGNTTLSSAVNWDIWLVRTDENGDSLWSRTFGGGGNDWCYSLVQTADGGYALAGSTGSFGAGGFWLLKLGPENSVPNDGRMTPLLFDLVGVYPNPFNSQAVASYELRVASSVSLKLYDLKGRLVDVLMDGWQAAGQYRAVIDVNGGQAGTPVLPAGVYLLRLTDGRQTALSKVCVVR
jgi:hypothetical protein